MTDCLIVEDNAIIREIMVQMVTDLDLVPVEHETASAAVDYCHAEHPAIVLLDWDLPAFGALDFLRGVGALDASLRPEIILIATENDHQQFALAKAAGARHHMLKPFDKLRLAQMLADIGIIKPMIVDELKLANVDTDELDVKAATV